jgi:hypothetical protein
MRFSSAAAEGVPPRTGAPAAIGAAAPVEARADAPPPSADATAPALDAPEAGAEPLARWRGLVDRVKERKLLLGTCLEEGMFLGIQSGKARVALSPEHAFHRAMLEMKENRAILDEELERSYGRGAALICEVASSDQAARRPMTAASPAGPAAGPGSGGGSPGIVERIVELFDGEILNPGSEGSGA